MARAASLESAWLPCYGWWPHPDEIEPTVIATPFHASVDPKAVFQFSLRGYAGSNRPVWEHEVGELRLGEERGVRLTDLDLPEPPPDGGILEVHAVRLDKPPKAGTGFIGMWIEAETRDGGGYHIPTIPIRAQGKVIQRDDLQVVPGIMVGSGRETMLVVLNVIERPTEVTLSVASPDGLVVHGEPLTIEPWSAWRGSLGKAVPRARSVLRAHDGVGSLAIQSSHRVLPYFGYLQNGGPLLCLDHTAPIFG